MIRNVATKLRRLRMKTLKSFGDRPSNNVIRLSLGDLNSHVTRALAVAFEGVPSVEVVEGNLLDAGCEAILSPANSFGDMGGGIDKVIDAYHGGAAQTAVMASIAEHFYGELPVGMALIVDIPGGRSPRLVVSPTMRIPGRVTGSLNAYLSLRAALVTVLRHNASGQGPIRTMAVPGLCTGVGAMHADEAASQMRVAYDNVIGGSWRQVVHASVAPYAMRS